MIVFFTTTLVISIVGLVGLIALKYWELKAERAVSLKARHGAALALSRAAAWAEERAPTIARRAVSRTWRSLERELHRAAAWSVLMAERGLEYVLHLVRTKTEAPRSGTQASAFLREVAAHKKALQDLSAEERTYEE